MNTDRFAVIVIALCSLEVFSQPTFEKIYLSGGSGILIELQDHNVMTGLCYASSHGFATGISIMDQAGDLIYSNCRAIDTMLLLKDLKQYTTNEFVFTSAYYKDTCQIIGTTVYQKSHPVIGRMDSLGNVLDASSYSFDAPWCSNDIGELEVLADYSVISWGGGRNFFALRVDSTMQPMWVKRFGTNGSFRFIRELPGGDLIAGINMDVAGAVVARMDAMGNFIWLKSYMRPKGMVHDIVIESDSSFIVLGYTDSTGTLNSPPLGYHPTMFMMKLNGSGDVQWCKGYDSMANTWHVRQAIRMKKTMDDNLIILSNLGPHPQTIYHYPFLMKADLNGDTIWTRSVGAPGYKYDNVELIAYYDGGFVFNGTINGNLPQNWLGAPYVFKTDSLGSLPCSERSDPIQITNLFPTDSSFMLTSTVNVASVHPAFAKDTVFDPIATYDACIVTQLPNYRHDLRPPRIRPNPNRGQFTVQFNDPLQVDSFYSVYDLTGKLLYQRPLPSGATIEDIDLSRFGKGTYLLRFTTPNEVWNERVVVE